MSDRGRPRNLAANGARHTARAPQCALLVHCVRTLAPFGISSDDIVNQLGLVVAGSLRSAQLDHTTDTITARGEDNPSEPPVDGRRRRRWSSVRSIDCLAAAEASHHDRRCNPPQQQQQQQQQQQGDARGAPSSCTVQSARPLPCLRVCLLSYRCEISSLVLAEHLNTCTQPAASRAWSHRVAARRSCQPRPLCRCASPRVAHVRGRVCLLPRPS